MDPEKFDEVTADCLEPGDLIRVDNKFLAVLNIEDRTDSIIVFFDDWGYEKFGPNEKVDLFAYGPVSID